MSSKPLVSGITPFLNAENFIEEAIESVFAQTYDHWELLLVDDGSTDNSTKIAQRYAQQHPEKVRYLKHEGHRNRGKSASRNLGIRNATGKFIAFLDADDLWLPFKLETQVPILSSQPNAAMLYGTTLFWHGEKRDLEDTQQDFVQELGIKQNTLIEPPRLLTLLLQNEDIHPTNCSLLVRRQLFDDIGGFEENFKEMYEDTLFLAKAFLEAPVFVTGECSAIYRLHANSSCHIAIETGQYHPTEPNIARGAFLQWLETYLLSKGVKNADVWRALQRELWPYVHPTAYSLLRRGKSLQTRTRWLLKTLLANIRAS